MQNITGRDSRTTHRNFIRPTVWTVLESRKKDNWLAPPHLGGPLKFSHATFDTVNEIDGTVKYHGDLIGNDLSHESCDMTRVILQMTS